MLPDVISHLSTSASSSSFKSILKFLLAFIEKDKQTEQLVEKLCARFKQGAPAAGGTAAAASNSWEHSRDLAYCLTMLNYNDRVLKKLAELFKLYVLLSHLPLRAHSDPSQVF